MLDFIIDNKIYVTYIFEFIAAVSGSYYLIKTPRVRKEIIYFSWFLWFVLLVDLSGLYALWAYFDDYRTFPFLENSLFTRNVWLYNWLNLISSIFYSFLFIKQIKKLKIKRILKYTLFGFIILGIFKLTSSDQLFYKYDMSVRLVGVLLLIIAIGIYYYELLMSDQILDIKRNLLFYISVGVFIWHLCVSPIDIYSTYFSIENRDFIFMHAAILRYCNIFMYGIFSFGFIYCAGKTRLAISRLEKSDL
ncbi:hypothetical protein BC962_2465 [Gillisia mitskevichiae]|uniref:Uncharacterized protein n=1 Tax=Gillisia mitskevichiae TaxID=270921 RepID=A0A495PMM8_9FLAO|nr:hypothetical protein [Gillisia mitskevichiae]RKS50692.1 hypothetical protein BC962_2465 [Gillisia mitskevichiae]